MLKRRIKSFYAIALVALTVSACTNQAPYIHNPSEFNRQSANFAKEIKDRDGVNICYNNRSTTVQDLLAMAQAECDGVFGCADATQAEELRQIFAAYTEAVSIGELDEGRF